MFYEALLQLAFKGLKLWIYWVFWVGVLERSTRFHKVASKTIKELA
jgi:hypothetical protein